MEEAAERMLLDDDEVEREKRQEQENIERNIQQLLDNQRMYKERHQTMLQLQQQQQ